MTPQAVDELWFIDFLVFVDAIENRLKQREAGMKGGIWIP